MRTIEGKMLLCTPDVSWTLATKEDRIDLRPIIDHFLSSLSGKRVSQKQEQGGYILEEDQKQKARIKLDFVAGKYALLKEEGLVVGSAYFHFVRILNRLFNCEVRVEIEEGKRISITPM